MLIRLDKNQFIQKRLGIESLALQEKGKAIKKHADCDKRVHKKIEYILYYIAGKPES